MNEERKMILEMVKDGAITIEEAEHLLEALAAGSKVETGGEVLAVASGGVMPKRILIRLTQRGKSKVNVKVPFSLVRAGLKIGKSAGILGAKYAKDVDSAEILETLKDIDVDEIMGCIADGDITLPYTIVDMEDEEKDEQVKIVLE